MPNLNEILEGGSEAFRRLNQHVARPVQAAPGPTPGPHSPVAPAVQATDPKPDLPQALDRVLPPKNALPVAPVQRPVVEIAQYRTKLLDWDNKWGACKPVLDALCAAGLIPGDKESDIELNVTQVKVRRMKHEGTGILIRYHDGP